MNNNRSTTKSLCMRKQYVLTIIGNDKSGLVDGLAKVVKEYDGNWLESRMANLAGKFSGIVLVSINAEKGDAFEVAVGDLQTETGLSVRATAIEDIPKEGCHTQSLTLVANDRPGILSELTSILATLGINVEELATDCSPAPMSSHVLFNAKAKISIPDNLTTDQVRAELETLADDLMVEIN